MADSKDDILDPSLEPTLVEPNDPLVGRLIGRYQLISMVAKGGTATVYRAMDTTLNREVAVKLLHEHLESKRDVVERFKKEAMLIAQFRHPNILDVYDFFDFQGRAALVVEFMPGITLSQLIKGTEKIPEDVVLMITLEILQGLKAAHEKGITHRDIKPANILLHPELGVKISDFGLAKIVHHDDGLTKDGVFVGTPSFSSPEQIEGHPVDHRSDLFSLGLTTYILATRSHAFKQKGDSTTTVWFKIVKGRFEAVRNIDPTLSAELDRILNKALQVDVEKRYQSATAMIKDVEALLAKRGLLPYHERLKEFLRAPHSSDLSRVQKLRRRIRILRFSLALITFCAALALFVWSFWEKPIPPPEVSAPSDQQAPELEIPSAPSEEVVVEEPAPKEEPQEAPKVEEKRPETQKRPSTKSNSVPAAVKKEVPIPEALSLGNQAIVVVADPAVVPGYRWEWNQDAIYELARDENFKTVVSRSAEKGKLKELRSIGFGKFYWRAGNTKGSLEIQSVDNYKKANSSVKRPVNVSSRFDDVDLQLNPFTQDLKFDWSIGPEASSYKLEVATDAAMKSLLFSGTLIEKTFLLPRNWEKNQTVHWRVTYRDEKGNPFLIDPIRRINLKLNGAPPYFDWLPEDKNLGAIAIQTSQIADLECSDVRKGENAYRWVKLSRNAGLYKGQVSIVDSSAFVVCRAVFKDNRAPLYLIRTLRRT